MALITPRSRLREKAYHEDIASMEPIAAVVASVV